MCPSKRYRSGSEAWPNLDARLKRLARGVRGEQVAVEARKVRTQRPSMRTTLSNSEKVEVQRLLSAGLSRSRVAKRLNLGRALVDYYWQAVHDAAAPTEHVMATTAASRITYTTAEDRRLSEL